MVKGVQKLLILSYNLEALSNSVQIEIHPVVYFDHVRYPSIFCGAPERNEA